MQNSKSELNSQLGAIQEVCYSKKLKLLTTSPNVTLSDLSQRNSALIPPKVTNFPKMTNLELKMSRLFMQVFGLL